MGTSCNQQRYQRFSVSQDLCATDAMKDMTFTLYASRVDRVRMVTLLRRHTTISVVMLLTDCCVISPSPLHASLVISSYTCPITSSSSSTSQSPHQAELPRHN